jgi:hypothetical protein
MLASSRSQSSLLHGEALPAFLHCFMLLWLLEPWALHVLVLIYTGAWAGWDLIELYTLLHVSCIGLGDFSHHR